ncbi:MAG: KamA family radical SAM protein [Chlamydiae bacterium]|nr:KamA family radical SAM protein [Chlamydiota bacterium]
MKHTIPLWRQIQRENFTRIESLLDFLEMSDEKRKKILISPRFSLNLPKRLAEKIEKNTLDDPIFLQFVPLIDETKEASGFTLEPLQDQSFRKTKKILQKYQGRALVLASGACAMHCRFCFRQNFPYETEEPGFTKEIEFLSKDPSLTEVILSGGDPLSLSNDSLFSLFKSLDEIPHLRRIRFHTRFPIGIPERVDDSFLETLKNSQKQIVFIIHCNHPKELDSDVLFALKKISCLGIPVLNQSVLLKGVNDNSTVLAALSESLINAGFIPYYLHELDPIQGAAHFALSPSIGPSLIRSMQEQLPGYGIPHLVRETPGYPSKSFITTSE